MTEIACQVCAVFSMLLNMGEPLSFKETSLYPDLDKLPLYLDLNKLISLLPLNSPCLKPNLTTLFYLCTGNSLYH